MFRTRTGLFLRRALVSTAIATVTANTTLSPTTPLLFTSMRFESTPSVSQRLRSATTSSTASATSPSSSSSFARKVKMATTATAGSEEERVRPVEPPTAAAADAQATRRVVKRKVIKKIVRKANGETTTTTVPAAAGEGTVNTGEALRRELRGIADAEAAVTNPAASSSATPAPSASPAPPSSSSSQKAQKTSLVKGFKIDEITSVCTPSDAIFARRLPSGGCQFFAWPGTPLEVASAAIVSMPDTIRTVHAVFGRPKTPIDLVMDIDCAVPQEHWSMSKIRPFQKKLLDDTLSVLAEEIAKTGEKIETQVVLQSPNLKKASFHIHTKLKDAAFEDYNSLHGFLARFHERMPNVDMQIYRPNGMLRMFSCMKENHTSAIIVFDDPKWNIGFKGGKVPDEAAALHSVIVRPAGTFKRLLKFEAPRPAYSAPSTSWKGSAAANHGRNSEGSTAIRPVVLLPRTEREAIENASRWLRGATEVEVSEWRSWIGLGLCAFRLGYHFRDAKSLEQPAMEVMLDAWVEASRHCPLKFRVGDCEQRWATFDIDKIGAQSDWWSAYLRLGRLEAASQESIERQEAERAAREARAASRKPRK